MTQTTLSNQEATFAVRPVLDVTRVDEHDVVHVGATPIAYYPAADVTTRRQVMVQLAEARTIPGVHIAERFGVTPVYVSQLRGRYRTGGGAALTARRRGPKGPMKVTPRLVARVRALRAGGDSHRTIARKLAGISHDTVRRILHDVAVEQPSLPVVVAEAARVPACAWHADRPPQPAAAAPVSASEAGVEPLLALPASMGDDRGAAVAPGESLAHAEAAGVPAIATSPAVTPSRYAGAMLLHVALAQLGVWQVFVDLGAQLGRTALGVAQVVGTVAVGFALRLGSIEGFKTALKRDFGALLGLEAVPSVQTLRTHVRALAESVAPEAVMRALLRALVQLEPVWEGAYYIDGHFSPYAGQEPVAKGWNAKRRLVEPGHTDVHVHDATSRALFFLNRPLNDALATVLPGVVAEIKAVVGDQPFLLVFDRGGYSGPAFRALTAQGVGFLTYLKGRKARRRFPADRFGRRWWAMDDPAGIGGRHRHVYRVYERSTRVTGTGLVRTLVVKDGEAQVPVLTNRAELPAAKAVHLLRMRWRQENSFKYLSTHYGIEQIIQYGATRVPDTRLVKNPARARLHRQIAALRATLVFQEADVGQAVVAGAPVNQVATLKTRRAMHAIEQRLVRLEHRLTQTPAKVPARRVPGRKRQRATLKSDRHDLVTAVKLATYNAERLLARRFFRHYEDPRDWLTTFRSLLHLSGTLSQLPTGTIDVALRPPDTPRVRHALEAFLGELNAATPKMFGTGPVLHFRLTSSLGLN